MNNSNIGRGGGGGGGGGGRGGFGGGGGGFRGGMGGQGFARSPMGNTGVVGPSPRVGPPAGRIVDRASFERAAAMQNAAARQQSGSFARRPGPGPHPGPGPGHRPRPYPRRFGGFAYTYPNYNVYYGYPGYFAESCQTAYLAWQNAVAAGADVATVATLKAAFESCLYTNSVAPLGFI